MMADGPEALREIVEPLAERIRALEAKQRANFAGGVKSLAFADLPTASETGRLLFVTDGRKLGEGVGAGTGVLVYDDAVAWRRTSDDTTVAV